VDLAGPLKATGRLPAAYLWGTGCEGGRGWDIFGRLVGADGVPVGNDLRISGPGAVSAEWLPAVAWDGADDQYLVVWMDLRAEYTRYWDIWARRLDSAGVPVALGFRVSGAGATADERNPAVAWNSNDDQFLVVREDWRNSASRKMDIWGRRVQG
jgi:hypothetical protein